MSKKIVLTRYDAAEYLRDEEDMALYLEQALEDGDPALIAHVLGDIARARGMAQIASEAGVGRESLYKALSGTGNPEFATIMKVVKALGLKLHATPAGKPVAAEPQAPYKAARKKAAPARKAAKKAAPPARRASRPRG